MRKNKGNFFLFSLPLGQPSGQKVASFPGLRGRRYSAYYNAKDHTAEVYAHDTKLKKRLLAYAAKFPELCQQTDYDEHGGLRFEIDNSRISIRLTAPYSEGRRANASQYFKRQIIANLRNNL